MLTPTELRAYRARYNALPSDVDAAYEKLMGNPDRLKVIRGALRLIDKHGATNYLGLFLLHRHFDCPASSVFVERKVTPTKGHAQVLVTKNERTENAPRRMAPYRFMFDARNAQPLEFTTDSAALAGYKQLVADHRATSEIGAYLADTGFTSILGIGIYARAGAAGTATTVFLEETNFRDRASIVHLLPRLLRGRSRNPDALDVRHQRAGMLLRSMCRLLQRPRGRRIRAGYCGHRKQGGGHMVCV